MKIFRLKNNRQGKILAAVLRENRGAFSRALFAAVRDQTCASWKVSQQFEQVKEWGRSQLLTAVDLLTAWFETRDPVYQELFAGWIRSRLVSDLSEEGAPGRLQAGQGRRVGKNVMDRNSKIAGSC